MIMPNTLVLVALLVAGCAVLASAAAFIVGADQGWMPGVEYTAWASGMAFAVGDKLVFTYLTKEHTVTEVRKKDYYACSGGDALSSDDSGATNVTLTGPGTRYFICNVTVHCSIGMKLAATVPGAGSPPGATSNIAAAGGALVPAMGSVSVVVVAAAALAVVRLTPF